MAEPFMTLAKTACSSMIGKHYKIIVPQKWNDAGMLVRRHVVKFRVIDVEDDMALVVYRNGQVGSLKIDDTFLEDPDYLLFDPRGNKRETQLRAKKRYQAKKRKRPI